MTRKVKIGVLGGSFDPPTKGHIEVAKCVLASGVVDRVELMPCYKHMFGKKMSPAVHRLNMCHMAIGDTPGILVSSFEIREKVTGGTYKLVKKFMKEFANTCDLYWIIGLDNANCINKWANYKKLIKLIPFIVVPRQGYNQFDGDLWYMEPPHVYLKGKKPLIQTSSTEAKQLIRSMDRLHEIVDPRVLSYSRNLGLYGQERLV